MKKVMRTFLQVLIMYILYNLKMESEEYAMLDNTSTEKV